MVQTAEVRSPHPDRHRQPFGGADRGVACVGLLARLEVNVSEIDLLAYSLETVTTSPAPSPAETPEIATWPATPREQLRASLQDLQIEAQRRLG